MRPRKGDMMTAERLQAMGYNAAEIAAILEMIEEIKAAR